MDHSDSPIPLPSFEKLATPTETTARSAATECLTLALPVRTRHVDASLRDAIFRSRRDRTTWALPLRELQMLHAQLHSLPFLFRQLHHLSAKFAPQTHDFSEFLHGSGEFCSKKSSSQTFKKSQFIAPKHLTPPAAKHPAAKIKNP